MPGYKLNLKKKINLVHLANRGAYKKQVFEVMHTGTPEAGFAQVMRIVSLQPQELHVLVTISSHADRNAGP